MPDIRAFALDLIARNPQVVQNPNAQAMLDVLQRGDAKQGREIASNLCKSYGVTPDQAVAQAKQFFHLP